MLDSCDEGNECIKHVLIILFYFFNINTLFDIVIRCMYIISI